MVFEGIKPSKKKRTIWIGSVCNQSCFPLNKRVSSNRIFSPQQIPPWPQLWYLIQHQDVVFELLLVLLPTNVHLGFEYHWLGRSRSWECWYIEVKTICSKTAASVFAAQNLPASHPHLSWTVKCRECLLFCTVDCCFPHINTPSPERRAELW